MIYYSRYLLVLFLGSFLINGANANNTDNADKKWDVEIDKRNRLANIYPSQEPDDSLPRGRSKLYGSKSTPTPIIQTYLPQFHTHHECYMPLYMRLPKTVFPSLPPAIQAEMEKDGIDIHNIRIAVSGQEPPLNSGPAGPFFPTYYPHYGTEPLAPHKGAYNVTRHVKMMITDGASPDVRFRRMPNEAEPLDIKDTLDYGTTISTVQKKLAITHPYGPDNLIVVSPVPVGVSGLFRDKGTSFYSYVAYEDQDKKHALITLHLLFTASQTNAFRTELWKSPRDLPPEGTAVYKMTTAELSNLCKNLINAPEFQDGGLHFQKLSSLLEAVDMLPEAVCSEKSLQGLGMTYRALRASGNLTEDNKFINYILEQGGYTNWAKLRAKDQGMIVAKVKSTVAKLEIEPLRGLGSTYSIIRKVGNNAPDEELISYILKERGFSNWNLLTASDRDWVVKKIISEAERLYLDQLLNNQSYTSTYFAIKKAGNPCSEEQIVKHILESSAGFTNWSKLTSSDRQMIVQRIVNNKN